MHRKLKREELLEHNGPAEVWKCEELCAVRGQPAQEIENDFFGKLGDSIKPLQSTR